MTLETLDHLAIKYVLESVLLRRQPHLFSLYHEHTLEGENSYEKIQRKIVHFV